MARAATLVLAAALAVLLLVVYPPAARAARTSPASTSTTQTATHKVSPDEMGAAAEDHECEGVGEQQEECMARRTLAAHTDYIYTQEHHN